MKWYIWLAIATALGLIIYFVAKNKKTSSSSTLANNLVEEKKSFNFNPYEITKIS
jgi:hypothetical protein